MNILKGEWLYIFKYVEIVVIGDKIDRGFLESIVFVSFFVDEVEYENYFVFEKLINFELKFCQFEYEIKDDYIIIKLKIFVICFIIEVDRDVEDNFIFVKFEKEYKINLNGGQVRKVCDLLDLIE